LRPGARVLDVGTGSGYLTSVLYRLVNGVTTTTTTTPSPLRGGTVVGIEHIPALTALAERNIRADGLDGAIDQQGIVLLTGDGRLGELSMYIPHPFSEVGLKIN
jgi:protein-L-isoaspartate(D-aspartate) O-methyltransferase